MNRKFIEAEFHRRLAMHMAKREQGIVMGELRAVLDEAEARHKSHAEQVAQNLEDTKERVYGLRDGE